MTIQKVSDRAKLIPRREPYWQRISKGCFLGFRRTVSSSNGNWIARFRDHGTGKQLFLSLGDFGNLSESDRFDFAKDAAAEWFRHLDKGGSPDLVTVRQACLRYLNHIKQQKGETPAKDIERRFSQYVFNDRVIADVEISKLTPIHLEGWRTRLAALPARSGPNRGKPRSASSLNRDMTCLRSALNLAITDGLISSDFAWKAKLKPIPGVDRKREDLITKAQRKALIEKLPEDLAELVMGACLIPIRPKALLELRVKDLDRQNQVLSIRIDKSGAGRKIRLPMQAFKHFENLCKDKLPSGHIFTQSNGQKWNRHAWKKPFRIASTEIGLSKSSVFYSLRHSLITELAHEGIDLLTIAQISGTSYKMIEKHYGHLTEKQSKLALEKISF